MPMRPKIGVVVKFCTGLYLDIFHVFSRNKYLISDKVSMKVEEMLKYPFRTKAFHFGIWKFIDFNIFVSRQKYIFQFCYFYFLN
jgi:hypothetical protein